MPLKHCHSLRSTADKIATETQYGAADHINKNVLFGKERRNGYPQCPDPEATLEQPLAGTDREHDVTAGAVKQGIGHMERRECVQLIVPIGRGICSILRFDIRTESKYKRNDCNDDG